MRKHLTLLSAVVLTAFSAIASAADTTVKILHLQDNPEFLEIWKGIGTDYEKQNPGVKIEWQFLENEAFKAKLPTTLQSGDEELIRTVAERGIDGTQPIIDDMAPLFHVRDDCPPLLLITGDRELEMLGRYEENAYLWRMMQVVEHPDTELFELQGYNHGQMARPAHPLMIRFIEKHSR